MTGQWGFPTDAPPPGDESPGFTPAERMPTAGSVARRSPGWPPTGSWPTVVEEAAGRLDEPTAAPWDPEHPLPLGQQLLAMVNHLNAHKAQLFYYLKLRGQAVNTLHMYGMA